MGDKVHGDFFSVKTRFQRTKNKILSVSGEKIYPLFVKMLQDVEQEYQDK